MGWGLCLTDQHAHNTQLVGLPLQGKCWTSLGPPTLHPKKAAFTFALRGQGEPVSEPSAQAH